jgi:Xaa-Pro aminopeptidase
MAYSRFSTDREERINYDRMRKFRLDRARAEMKKAGLGALLSWEAWDIRYMTGVYVTPPTRWIESQGIVVPVNGDPYVYAGSSGYPSVMRREMPWLKGKIGPEKFPRLKMATRKEDLKSLVDLVARIMNEHGVAKQPLGLDGCSSELLVQAAFKDVGIEVADAKEVMFEARKIKNQDEIECIRIACANAEAAFADIKDAIRPGISECELVGIGMKKLYALGSDETQEFVCLSGELTNPFRTDYTERQVRPGDLVIIDINGNSFQGYKSCYYRTFVCGKPTAEQDDIFEECRAMMYAGMAAVKAGNTTLDICEKWPTDPHYWGPYEHWYQVGGLAMGHGIGISLHEKPWISLPQARANPEKLEEGMVIALETWTGKYGGKDGVRLEEQMVVTKDGYDLLSKWPVDKLTRCWV